MRSCFSGAAFSMASPVETQQAFLEGHFHAFSWFDGVFEEVRYEYVPPAHIRSSVPDRVMWPPAAPGP